MEYRWMMYSKKADFNQISEQFHIDPVLARIIRNREVTGEEAIQEYLQPDIGYLYSPWYLKDMEEAVGIILDKILLSHKIRIISDYDVDGVMSNYILYKGLLRAGADVDYEIPDRVQDGYGMNEAMIDRAQEAGINTIITCDNGIAASSAIQHAKELGLTVIVTDHHEVPFEEIDGEKQYILPDADAVVDPKRGDCNYPLPEICGAAVAYKLIEGVYERKGIDKQELYPLLEFVAMATICDVMPLLDENRCFVKLGLDMLNHTTNEGMKALLVVNDLQDKFISEHQVGFVLGPCINATGRLDSAMLSMQLLLTEEKSEAMELARQLYELNEERKALTLEYTEKAYALVEQNGMQQDRVLVIYLENCHESIAGIIAGRVRERYYRPVLVLCDADEDMVKGSGRSIEEYHMYDALNACQEYLVKFGGHAMAAGFSLMKENIEILRQALNEQCPLAAEEMLPTIMVDVPMPIDYISFDFVSQLELLKPFGKANEKPLFAQTQLKVLSAKVLGKNANVLKLTFESASGTRMEGVYFEVDAFLEDIKKWFGADECDQMLHGWLNTVVLDVAYYPTINEFNGMQTLQLNVKYYRKHEEA